MLMVHVRQWKWQTMGNWQTMENYIQWKWYWWIAYNGGMVENEEWQIIDNYILNNGYWQTMGSVRQCWMINQGNNR